MTSNLESCPGKLPTKSAFPSSFHLLSRKTFKNKVHCHTCKNLKNFTSYESFLRKQRMYTTKPSNIWDLKIAVLSDKTLVQIETEREGFGTNGAIRLSR